MTALDDAVAEIVAAGDSRPVSGRALNQIITRISGALQGINGSIQGLNDRLDTDEDAAAASTSAIDARLDALEAVTPVTVAAFTNVSQLPASATVFQWFRVRNDSAVYVGNGAGQPLTKIQTVPLP